MENYNQNDWQGKSNKQVEDSLSTFVICVKVLLVGSLIGVVFYLLS